jgi:hypothetical protein
MGGKRESRKMKVERNKLMNKDGRKLISTMKKKTMKHSYRN